METKRIKRVQECFIFSCRLWSYCILPSQEVIGGVLEAPKIFRWKMGQMIVAMALNRHLPAVLRSMQTPSPLRQMVSMRFLMVPPFLPKASNTACKEIPAPTCTYQSHLCFFPSLLTRCWCHRISQCSFNAVTLRTYCMHKICQDSLSEERLLG